MLKPQQLLRAGVARRTFLLVLLSTITPVLIYYALAMLPGSSLTTNIAVVAGATVLLAFAVTALLTRHSLNSIRAFHDGTFRMLHGNFDAAVEVESDGEFASLAYSFNEMSKHLDRQMKSLELRTHIDQEILKSNSLPETLQAVLMRILKGEQRSEVVGVFINKWGLAGRPEYLHLSSWDPQIRHQILDGDLFANGQEPTDRDIVKHLGNEPDRSRVFPLANQEIHAHLVVQMSHPEDRETLDAQQLENVGEQVLLGLTLRLRERQLRQLAFFDMRTGLASRERLAQQIDKTLSSTKKGSGRSAVMLIHFDGLQDVNSKHGHTVGDFLLRKITARIRSVTRQAACVARIGGAEFALLLTDVVASGVVKDVAEKIAAVMAEPFRVDHLKIFTSVSIGIAMLPEHGDSHKSILDNAHLAMEQARDSDSDECVVYESEMSAHIQQRNVIEKDLLQAMHRGELSLHYQPQVEFTDGQVSGVEALLRWNHKDGEVSPLRFIPMAEDTGLINEVGQWMLEQSCFRIAQLNRNNDLSLKLGINLSPMQILHGDVPKSLERVAAEMGVDMQCLDMEITESTVLMDFDRVVAILSELRGMGVSVSIDDFGTGYSSISHLRRLPVDAVKIDRAFISEFVQDSRTAGLASTIVAMAHDLGLRVVAEGVESQWEAHVLREAGCDAGQGNLFCAPVPFDDLGRFVSENSSQAVEFRDYRNQHQADHFPGVEDSVAPA